MRGLAAAMAGHSIHWMSLNYLRSDNYSVGIPLFLLSSIIYLYALQFISPSNCCNSFSIITIASLLLTNSCNLTSLWVKSGLALYFCSVSCVFIWGPPSYDNIGTTELIHLTTSPLGILMCFLYILMSLISWLLTRKWLLSWSAFVGHTLASFINLSKLVSNQITLTHRIENQWQFPLTNVVVFAYFVSGVLYLYGVRSLIQQIWSAAGLSLFYASFAITTIASATIVFGDPIMLTPIGVAGFLVNAHLIVISTIMISFPSLPWMPRIEPDALKRSSHIIVEHFQEIP
jgi:hypothetical protein